MESGPGFLVDSEEFAPNNAFYRPIYPDEEWAKIVISIYFNTDNFAGINNVDQILLRFDFFLHTSSLTC